jgi:hypothetical protein
MIAPLMSIPAAGWTGINDLLLWGLDPDVFASVLELTDGGYPLRSIPKSEAGGYLRSPALADHV